MMKYKILTAASLLISGVVSAATLDTDNFSVTYDDATLFGAARVFETGIAGRYGLEWTVPSTVSFVQNGGPASSIEFVLPTFTVTAKNGSELNGLFSGSVGNLVYSQFNGSATAYIGASVAHDGVPMYSLEWWPLLQTESTSNSGYFASRTNFAFPLDGLHSVTFSDAFIHFDATRYAYVAVTGQPQNRLTFEFGVAAVPEPESYALMLAGLGIVGFLASRRRQG
ncbi:PEP-CTERM sorting domain-containing protein [Roseateles asaccharophilus]|uniref:Ice-binding protein C-terminal domain-containing protein n=1 Tax=Roseateles asaccharophilus TaxID=582607 RepID=A0ABU2A5D5_9BURK|nr:PEP-CTERM sorting domain-containing protein [Roseateles asaccharophilus]MDR7332335.1 hypothetical protein [Roseateles asaccharophilus]